MCSLEKMTPVFLTFFQIADYFSHHTGHISQCTVTKIEVVK